MCKDIPPTRRNHASSYGFFFLNSRPFLCGFVSVSINDALMSGSDFPAARSRPTGAGVSDRSVGDLCTFDQICQRNDIAPKPSTAGDAVLTTRGSAAGVVAARATAAAATAAPPLMRLLDAFRVRERLLISGRTNPGLPFSLPLLLLLLPSSALGVEAPVRMRRLFLRRHATGGW